MKIEKAPSLTSRMMKCSDRSMFEHQQTLVNNMESGLYPASWNQRLTCSIYKSAKEGDSNNCRGITLSKCLGKLFNTILYNRLQN